VLSVGGTYPARAGVFGKVANADHYAVLAVGAPEDRAEEARFLVFDIAP
jgi:hypothetical protein